MTTATVETVTAEVRVLMIGSRQVTLSVARQLDKVPFEQLDPIGRVRTGRKDIPRKGECEIEVVGRENTTGALVFAFAPAPVLTLAPVEFVHWAMHRISAGEMKQSMRYVAASDDENEIVWTTPNLSFTAAGSICPLSLNDNPHRGKDQELSEQWRQDAMIGRHCNMFALQQFWTLKARRQLRDDVKRSQMLETVKALPLIVLAGLK